MSARFLAVLLALFGASIMLAGTASALPGDHQSPRVSWTAELEGLTNNAQNQANAWAGSLGVSTPSWVHNAEGQTVCLKFRAQYCRNEATVYFMPSGISSWVNAVGPVGAVYQAGHEISHHFQYVANPGTVMSVPMEQQANCGSGVFLRWLVNGGGASDAEVQMLIGQLRTIANDGSHGSPAAWADVFRTGYNAGTLAACLPLGGPMAGA